MAATGKKYDIVLFGVTGFTGKLAAEYLLDRCRNDYSSLSWACSARNQAKAEKVLNDLVETVSTESGDTKSFVSPPEILQVDLLCTTREEEVKLREIVKSTKVCLTCSGPFELYGKKLVQICAEEGVHYADITGETDFVREMIVKYDKTARETGACILPHCGNDCIPSDLTVLEMNNFVKKNGFELKEVQLYEEHGADAAWSGGTLATASYQMGKDRKNIKKTEFDPLITTTDGSKSEFLTKNITPKRSAKAPDEVGYGTSQPWVMGPVMVNCIKRSNALLGYSKELKCGDLFLVKEDSWSTKLKLLKNGAMLYAAIVLPRLFAAFVPQPGDGPDRKTMEEGSLTVHGVAKMVSASTTDSGSIEKNSDTEKKVKAVFHFNKDVSYLYTAVLLVETGMLLVERSSSAEQKLNGGLLTPATALGSDLTQRILKQMDTSFSIEELEDDMESP
mmetsp:Transcript_23591/g.65479  ORF Transcript_23591/g.65479 Transcript_23591/m.65479 type:complete len:449 (-) Transcript_23591:214-1560(-)|eukprot:CAMPEP_0172366310 /NCGR_PEP_ID=MMETSP1060-20121228/14752_1 /TAXON_ID=37318 /ORGANISM="Pseudo-nitzschia pungens, Strain cf. cingulata" /LENGTH=448 /DNA_ID=CAMNT_0013090113 /DNA_START=45 /DNA_END=1391 /DNA_ORIENTATION=-